MLKNCWLLAFVAAFLTSTQVKAQYQESIGLQNIRTREVAYCYNNSHSTAEECAQYFETQGFIRMKYIPYKTAKFDFLTVETYPTRRWRQNELTPRW